MLWAIAVTLLILAGGESVAHPAVALEGGGFRAQSVNSGFVAGMLAYVGREKNLSAPTMEATGLLSRFRTFSTNSGSSWFTSMLVYSKPFKKLLESIAVQPDKAASLYRGGYAIEFLQATNVDTSRFHIIGKLARAAVQKLLGTGDEDSIYLLTFFLLTGFSWNHFVETLLSSTGGLLPAQMLGSDVAEWSKGKVWMPVHSVVLPMDRKTARLYQGKLAYPQVSYQVIAPAGYPIYIPAAFSVTLGSGKGSRAPYNYVAPSAVAPISGLKYRGVVVPGVVEYTATSTNTSQYLSPTAFLENVGMLPISRVAAASSAFIGSFCTDGFVVDEVQALISGDVTPWVSASPMGGAFHQATDLVSALNAFGGVHRSSVQALADAGVHGLLDGAYTDNTGVAAAVTAGSDEVLVLLNCNASGSLLYLFKGGPPPDIPDEPASLFPVFESPVAADVAAVLSNLHLLYIVDSASYLKSIATGTVLVTTAANTAWGIAKGRQVKLNIVAVTSNLDIGEWENLEHFDALVQEVVQTLLMDDNREYVRHHIMPWLFGSSAILV